MESKKAVSVAWQAGFAPELIGHTEVGNKVSIQEAYDMLPSGVKHMIVDAQINGFSVPRDKWHIVKAVVKNDVPVAITFHSAPEGGGGGGKKVLAGIAFIAASFIPGANTYYFSTMVSQSLGQIAFNIGASMVLSGVAGMLAGTPSLPNAPASGDSTSARGDAALQGNVAERYSYLPRVVGTHKVFPPFIQPPAFTFDTDGNEFVEAVYGLGGMHSFNLNDIFLGDARIIIAEDTEVEWRNGYTTDTPLTLVTKQTFTDEVRIELSRHQVTPDKETQLLNQTNPKESCPVWHTVSNREDSDLFQMHLVFPAGIFDPDTPDNHCFQSFKFRFRQKGAATWINCPLVVMTCRRQGQLRAAINFHWVDATDSNLGAASVTAISKGPVFRHAYVSKSNQTSAPGFAGWTADPYFSDYAATPRPSVLRHPSDGATIGIHRNYKLEETQVHFYLNKNIIPKGNYEFQIIQGVPPIDNDEDRTLEANFNNNDPMEYINDGGNFEIPMGKVENRMYQCMLLRIQSIWYEHPTPIVGDSAYIAIKAKNRRLPPLSVNCSGIIKSGITGLTNFTSSNPAEHFYDFLTGDIVNDPLPLSITDTATLSAWRTNCNTKGYQVNGILQQQSSLDALNLIAACGYGKPYMSEVWGVVYEYNRSAVVPVQVFTPMNSKGFSYTKALNKLLDAVRTNYMDKDNSYIATEKLEYYPTANMADPRIEAIEYWGHVTEAEVVKRAQFDMESQRSRNTIYTFTADLENIVCRRGDLIAIQTDVIETTAGYSRVLSKNVVAGNIVSLTLEHTIDFAAGANAMSIRRFNGQISVFAITNSGSSSNIVTLTAPIADTTQIDTDCLVTIGKAGSAYKRLLVGNIEPQSNLEASITCFDEATNLLSLI